MSYRVIETEFGGYDILERETDIMIELNLKEKDAKDLCRKLNLGSGFAGWTPKFITGQMQI